MLIEPYDLLKTVLISSMMVMTTQRRKKKGLRKRKIKDKEREEAGRAPDKLLSQACRCRQGFGRRGGREGQKQREEVEYAQSVSSSLCKGHLSWHGLCATWLWTHLYRTEEIKKPGVRGNLPLFLQGEPMGNLKNVTLWPASLPVRVATSEAQESRKPSPNCKFQAWLGLSWAIRRKAAYCKACPRHHGLAISMRLGNSILLFSVSVWVADECMYSFGHIINLGSLEGMRGAVGKPQKSTWHTTWTHLCWVN